jgi:hypothetical protein
MLDERFTVPDHVVHRRFAAETVVLNLQTGGYHGLNPVAGRMLEVLVETQDPRQVAARVAAEYGAEVAKVEADVANLCADLLQRGLIDRVASDSG